MMHCESQGFHPFGLPRQNSVVKDVEPMQVEMRWQVLFNASRRPVNSAQHNGAPLAVLWCLPTQIGSYRKLGSFGLLSHYPILGLRGLPDSPRG